MDKIFSLSPLQKQVFDAACDVCTYDEAGLAELIDNCKSLNAAECRQTIASLRD